MKTLSPEALSIVPGGIYEHYKKLYYKVLGIARHSESLEELVVYQALYGKHDIWVRSVVIFLEDILIDGSLHPRFKLVQDRFSS